MSFFKKPTPKPDRVTARRSLLESIEAATHKAVDAGVDRRTIADALDDVAAAFRVADPISRPMF